MHEQISMHREKRIDGMAAYNNTVADPLLRDVLILGFNVESSNAEPSPDFPFTYIHTVHTPQEKTVSRAIQYLLQYIRRRMLCVLDSVKQPNAIGFSLQTIKFLSSFATELEKKRFSGLERFPPFP